MRCDFSSDLVPARSDPIRARDRLRFDGLLPGDLMRTMPVTLEVQRDRLQSDSSIFGANADLKPGSKLSALALSSDSMLAGGESR